MRVKISEVNLTKLLAIQNNINLPITTLANACIWESVGEKVKLLDVYKKDKDSKEIEVKFRIYENEKNHLLSSSKSSGTNSLAGEIRYRLLNTIYKKGFLSPQELKIIGDLKLEINKIGINLHQILKKINFREKTDDESLVKLLQELTQKTQKLSSELATIPKYVNSRLKNNSTKQSLSTKELQKSIQTIDIDFEAIFKEFLNELTININQNIKKEVLEIKAGVFGSQKRELRVINNPSSLLQDIKINFENQLNKIKMEIEKDGKNK